MTDQPEILTFEWRMGTTQVELPIKHAHSFRVEKTGWWRWEWSFLWGGPFVMLECSGRAMTKRGAQRAMSRATYKICAAGCKT